jgi:hypothetical protein
VERCELDAADTSLAGRAHGPTRNERREGPARTGLVNFQGMSIRQAAATEQIRTLVWPRLGGLDHKVRAIVNYENFAILPELLDAYPEMVAVLSNRFYLGTTRYTTSGFLRVKLGDAPRQRRVAPISTSRATRLGRICAMTRWNKVSVPYPIALVAAGVIS